MINRYLIPRLTPHHPHRLSGLFTARFLLRIRAYGSNPNALTAGGATTQELSSFATTSNAGSEPRFRQLNSTTLEHFRSRAASHARSSKDALSTKALTCRAAWKIAGFGIGPHAEIDLEMNTVEGRDRHVPGALGSYMKGMRTGLSTYDSLISQAASP